MLPDADQLKKSGPLWRVIEVLLALGVLGMLVILIIQVIGRLAGASPSWTEEASRFLFMDGVFLGFAAGFRAAVHPRVSYLVARGPGWLGKVSLHTTVVTAILFFTILAWKSIELVMQQMRTNETSPALAVSMWIITVPLAIAAVLSIVGVLQSVYFDKNLRQRLLEGEVIA
ncbi:TRAP transporter small permease [Agrococcus sp. TSP3-2-1]|uniref:TRAP transporter small permease n=1 Tax=Agrococcus sp. TSP3-2-1 TaxID=2804583 RepID=UPI003CF1C00B